MKSARYIVILMLLHLVLAGVEAQSTNTLTIPDVKARYGKVWLPVIVGNTDEIVAMQFDLTLPKNVTTYRDTPFELTERSQGMVASVTLIRENVYRVLLYSPDNFHITGHSGEVMRIALDIPQNLQEGESYDFNVNDAVLSKVSGENVLTGVSTGSLYIKKGPDLLVKDIVVDADDPGPGDKVRASWIVENVGEMKTGRGWKEYISLVTLDGNASKTIVERTYDAKLAPGIEVSRSVEAHLPDIIGVDGLSRLKVVIMPLTATDEASEARGNNTAVSDTVIDIQKQLSLDIFPKTVKEGGNTPVKVKLTRSGRTDISQSFNIISTQDSRVNIPDEITISSNSSSYEMSLNIVGNDEADADSVINVKIGGNGYQPVSGSFKIIDNIYPMLGLNTSSRDVYEGRTFYLNITRNFANQKPLEVEIASDGSGRFEFPSRVTLQPGEYSKSVEVKVTDNDEIETDESFAFRVTSELYESSECLVMFHDNDLPSLSFVMSPDAIGEAQGAESPAIGVIRSTDELNTSIEFRFSNDSNGELKLPQSVIMPSGSKEVQIPIYIEKDNTDNEGDRTYNISAMVYSPSCRCTLSGSVGAISTTLTIIDDDGPALNISSEKTSVLEGSKKNVFTIKSNNTPATDLHLHISSNRDDMLVYNHELTLSKGSSSAQLLVDVQSNSQAEGDELATIKVQTDGYAMGTYSFIITDQNLPDATVRIMLEKTAVEAEGEIPMVLCVRNTGNYVLNSGIPIAIELAQGEIIKNKVVTTLSQAVEVGDSILMNYNYAVPTLVGQYILRAHINPTQKSVKELIYVNNRSNDVGISIVSPISLTAKSDKSFYRNGEVVTVSGQASGDKGKNAEVKVYFVNTVNGKPVRQEMKVKTDENGHYSYSWHPASTQVGHFSVGACYPTDNKYVEMDAFDITGLNISQSYFQRDLVLSRTDTVKVKIKNPLDVKQTNLKVTEKGSHEGCEVGFSYPDHIEGGDSVLLEIYLKGTKLTQGNKYLSLPLEVTTAEGAVLKINRLYYYVNPPKAYLWTNTKTINTTMTIGQTKEYPIVIHNKGLESTGTISLNMSASQSKWISPKSFASIEPGDSATVVLKFTRDETMEINKPKNGVFNLVCKDSWVSIDYDITPVTETKGKLTLDVVDNYTYYGIDEDTQLANTLANTNSFDSAPHVDNAKVTVRKPGTNELVTEGTTSGNGLFMVELPGGFYNFTVEAEGHKKETFEKEIPSGMESKHEVMLFCEDNLDASFNVEETEIEDEYSGAITYTFETSVPVPRLIVTLPKERPLPGTVFPVSIANKGYVNAYEASLNLGVSKGYELQFLNETYWDILGPNQSQIVYVMLVESDSKPAQAKRVDVGAIDSEDCSTLALDAVAEANVRCDKYKDGIKVPYHMKWGKIDCVSKPSPVNPGSNDGETPTKDNPQNDPSGPKDYDNPVETVVLDCISCNFDCPTLNYLVVRVGGNPLSNEDIRKGVFADGQSKVKILLGPGSTYPPKSCSEGESHYWYLSEQMGKLSGSLNDWQIVYYTAPDHLPEGEKTHTIYVIHEWTWKGCKGIERIPIEVMRPPLLLPNGMNDNNANEVDYEEEDEEFIDNSASVCSSIKLVISQSVVMTRQAFRGTLSLKNKLEDIPMKNVKFILDVRDANGKVATSREMQVDVESLTGLTGDKNLTSGWTLAPKTDGKVSILFIPTKFAAPTEPMVYSFGGTLTYTDPYTDRTISRQFTPVKLEVRPSPVIELAYFMQRDVLGDDPLTESVEPVIPAEFALLVNNKGYGDAKNMKITTEQPEIVENEKGLAIDFEIVSSQLNGGEKQLALGESVVSDFGTIKAHSQAYAQWWLQSSLLGHFTEYDVDVTHVTSHNNPDLSLIEENPVIHELIRGFDCYENSENRIRGFLVNDIPDKKDMPDHVYFTDATDDAVFMVYDMRCERGGDLSYKLNVTPSVSGWNYGVMTDPTNGKGELLSIVRERDGKVLATDNVWRTDRTLRDGKDPVYENKLHFVGNFTGAQESYILTFSPAPDLTLDVENVYGLPDENTMLQSPLKQIQVVFNKPIVSTSFGVDDITLVCQGQAVETAGVTITRMDDKQYQIDLSAATLDDGYYVLTIFTNQITDQEGFTGKSGKQVSWVQYAGGMTSIVIKAEPENGGTVSPSSGRFEYGKTIRLEAVPAEGYAFSYWTKDGVTLSEDAAYDYYVSEHAELHAVFLPQVYKVDISCDPQKGFIIGTPARSYYYDYGTMLHLVAQPMEGYVLKRWMVNGLQAGVKDSCDIVVTGPMSIAPLFVEITDGLDGLVKKSGSIKYWPIPVDDLLYISGDFKQIREVKVYDLQGNVCLICGDVGENGAVSMLSLPSGMYIISVATDNGSFRGKVMKR